MTESEATCTVREYGAVGDGATRDTDAIQEALDACAADGGTIVVRQANI